MCERARVRAAVACASSGMMDVAVRDVAGRARLEHAIHLLEECRAVHWQDVLEHVLRVDDVKRVVLKGPAVAGVLAQDVAAGAPVLADEADRQSREDEVGVQPAVAALVPPVAADLQVLDAVRRQLRLCHIRALHTRLAAVAIRLRLEDEWPNF